MLLYSEYLSNTFVILHLVIFMCFGYLTTDEAVREEHLYSFCGTFCPSHPVQYIAERNNEKC